jgi:hypothetical protein
MKCPSTPLLQFVLAHHPGRVIYEQHQQIERLRGDVQRLAVTSELAPVEIEREAVEADRSVVCADSPGVHPCPSRLAHSAANRLPVRALRSVVPILHAGPRFDKRG